MAANATGGNEDFHLSFESTRQLFTEITPARLNDLGLVERTDGEMFHVPFDDVEVHFRLAPAA